MAFRMPGNETWERGDRALRQRALRFAGVVLEAPESLVRPRPEAVSGTDDDSRLKHRVDRFAQRLGDSRQDTGK